MTALRVPYRGDRDYVHGTTLFGLLSDHCLVPGASALDFRVNRRIDSNAFFLHEDLTAAEALRHPCSLAYEAGGTVRACAVEEAPCGDASMRQPYDEEALVAAARFIPQGQSVAYELESGTPFIDALVALNKALLKRHSPLPAGSQFVFTRLELPAPPPTAGRLEIAFWRSLGGAHFISRLQVDGSPSGRIHFSSWG